MTCSTAPSCPSPRRLRNNAELFQPFPTATTSSLQLNPSVDDLQEARRVGENATVYQYIVRSAKCDQGYSIEQSGSAPNFQGGRITLCTCKHSMRAGRLLEKWPGTWVAGFTSGAKGPQALFYLMRVEHAFDSHYELWHYLQKRVCRAKSMELNRLGDLCPPRRILSTKNRKALFDPANYRPPCNEHVHEKNWRKDLDFRDHDSHGRRAPLLLGDAEFSFLWSKPCLAWPQNAKKLTQGCKKVESIGDLLNSLRPL